MTPRKAPAIASSQPGDMGKRFLLDPDCCIDEKTGKPLYPLRKDFKVPDWGLMG